MPHSVPTPVAAALGLVPTVLGGVRRLPGKAVQLPVLAVSSTLTALDTARREYDDLAERGERLVARLRGTSLDQLEDAVEERVQGTVLEGAYDRAEDVVEDLVAAGEKTAGMTLRAVTETVDTATAAVQEELPPAEAPKENPTPKATEPDTTRIDTAAGSDVVDTVERVAAASAAPVVEHRNELPLADYDHMTLGSLRGRLRSLTIPELVQVREYEKDHADRLPVVTMLDNRIAKLATDAAATPAPGSGSAVQPGPGPDVGGKVAGPATAKTGLPRTKVRTT